MKFLFMIIVLVFSISSFAEVIRETSTSKLGVVFIGYTANRVNYGLSGNRIEFSKIEVIKSRDGDPVFWGTKTMVNLGSIVKNVEPIELKEFSSSDSKIKQTLLPGHKLRILSYESFPGIMAHSLYAIVEVIE